MKLTQILVVFTIFVCFFEAIKAEAYGFESILDEKPNNLQTCKNECKRIENQCKLEDVPGRAGSKRMLTIGVSNECHLKHKFCNTDCEKKFRNY